MSRFTFRVSLLSVVAALAAFATNARAAGSATSNVAVSAKVQTSCTIAAGTLAFGDYDPTGGALDVDGSVSITCVKGTVATVTLGYGTNAGGTTVRKMKETTSGDLLTYEIYTNSGRTTAYSPSVGYTTLPAASKNTPIPVPLYGRITAGQDVSVGDYSDTVVATVNF